MAIRNAVVAAALALAACSPPAPAADSQGQAARKVMDAASANYSQCVTGHAGAMPVDGDAAGSLALRILKSCRPARDVLVAKVAAFHRIGHPKESQAMAQAVADASVQTADDDLRQQAVVTIVKRQGDQPGIKI